MPDTGDDTALAVAYPPTVLYEDWKADADRRDVSCSTFIIQMVENGRKNLQFDDVAATSLRDLQQQRTDLQQALEQQRDRIERLERHLHQTAFSDIVKFVEENPGASAAEIIQHVADTVPGRVVGHLDLLEGDAVRRDDDCYYPRSSQSSSQPDDESSN